MPAHRQELMNAISKPRLRLFLLVGLYKQLLLFGFSAPRAQNRQRGFEELVHMHGQSSSDKDRLNILRGEGARKRGGPSTGSGNIRAGIPRQEIAAGAGIQPNDKITEDLEQEKGAGIGAGTRAGKRAGTVVGIRAGIETSTEQGDERREDLGQRNKGDLIEA